jgi:hypothetical protein
VVFEPDFDSILIDGEDKALTRQVAQRICDRFANGRCGRQLPRFFRDASLIDIRVLPKPLLFTDYDIAARLSGFETILHELEAGDPVRAPQAAAMRNALRQAAQTERFLFHVVGFTVRGRKP